MATTCHGGSPKRAKIDTHMEERPTASAAPHPSSLCELRSSDPLIKYLDSLFFHRCFYRHYSEEGVFLTMVPRAGKEG